MDSFAGSTNGVAISGRKRRPSCSKHAFSRRRASKGQKGSFARRPAAWQGIERGIVPNLLVQVGLFTLTRACGVGGAALYSDSS